MGATATEERPVPDPELPAATYLTQVLEDLAARRRVELARHEREMHDIDAGLRQAERERSLVLKGVPLTAVRTAEDVVWVRGESRAGDHDAQTMLRAAIADLAHGPKELRRDYFGTKDYDRWRGQGFKCSYGRAPSHGSIVFEVGLRGEGRSTREYSAEEIEAAILYLMTFLKGGS